jgi:hypothetical protein
MDNVTFIEIETPSGSIIKNALIENADGSVTSMLKSTYEAQQAKQSTPMIPGND